MALEDPFDTAYTLAHDLENIFKAKIPFMMLTESKSLLNLLAKTKYTTKKRLIIDVQTVSSAYYALELNEVALIRPEYNIANSLAKPETSAILKEANIIGKLDHPV